MRKPLVSVEYSFTASLQLEVTLPLLNGMTLKMRHTRPFEMQVRSWTITEGRLNGDSKGEADLDLKASIDVVLKLKDYSPEVLFAGYEKALAKAKVPEEWSLRNVVIYPPYGPVYGVMEGGKYTREYYKYHCL